jgi:hypothetical protein
MAYLWQRRVALGVDLLTNTGLGVSAVAERCGFKTVHHLSRRIKQATGLPPAALRRAVGRRGHELAWDSAWSSVSPSPRSAQARQVSPRSGLSHSWPSARPAKSRCSVATRA